MKLSIAAATLYILMTSMPFQAQASGCGGPWPSATGKEIVIVTNPAKFSYARSNLRCEIYSNSPGWTFCSVAADYHQFQISIQKTPQEMFAHFEALDGKDVYISKVNLEYKTYDDCNGDESDPWWQGHHRLNAGALGPFYATGEDNLPPF